MKRSLLFFLFLTASVFCIAQPIIQRGGVGNTVADARWQATLNAFLPRFSDTTSANLSKGIDSCGAFIFTYDYNAMWFRACSPKHWIMLLPTGTVSADSFYWKIGGNINVISDASLNATFGTLFSNGIKFTTNGISRFTLNRNGVQPISSSVKPLGIDTATGYLSYAAAGGGGTVTASNGLTKVGDDIQLGGTLTGNTFIAGGGNTMNFTNLSRFNFTSSTASTLRGSSGNLDGYLIVDAGVALFSAGNSTTQRHSDMHIVPDSIDFTPSLGVMNIDTLQKAVAANDSAMTWNPTTGAVGYKAFPKTPDSTTASNGLTKVGNDIRWGGTLNATTTIDGNDAELHFNNINDYSVTSNTTQTFSANIISLKSSSAISLIVKNDSLLFNGLPHGGSTDSVLTINTTTKAVGYKAFPSAGGGGTVTNVSSATADATVSNPTTTPQITIVSAPKWTTARNLAGNSVDGSANVNFSNKFIVQGTTDAGLTGAQFLGALTTGIVKNTTTTGVLSIAVAADFPTLNQNTTGSAASLTTTRTIGTVTGDATSAGSTFNGTANNTNALTFATVNSNVGSFTNANITVNAKGLITAASNGTSGTVTSVATGYGLSGGTITTTGTLIVDSATLSVKYLRRGDSIGVAGFATQYDISNLFNYWNKTGNNIYNNTLGSVMINKATNTFTGPVGTDSAKFLVKGINAANGYYAAAYLDSSGKVTHQWNNSGRWDAFDYLGQGATAALYNMSGSTGTAGHYAMGAKNAAGNLNTVAYTLATVTDITTASMSSSLHILYMDKVNTASGYSQPNRGINLSQSEMEVQSDNLAVRTGFSTAQNGVSSQNDAGYYTGMFTYGSAHAVPAVRNTSQITTNSPVGTYINHSASTGDMYFTTNSSTRMSITNGGSVNVVSNINTPSVSFLGGVGTGRDNKIYAFNSGGDGIATTALYPASSTNVAADFGIIPKGTGFSSTFKSSFGLFNTDYVADQTNFELCKFRAAGTDGYALFGYAEGTGSLRQIYINATGSVTPGAANIICNTSGTVTMKAYGAGVATFDAAGNISSASDERLKNIQGFSKVGLAAILKLRPINYKWNKKSGNEMDSTYTGFSAQEVKANIPNGTGVDNRGYLSLQDRAVLSAVVNGEKELYELIVKQQREIDILKKKLNAQRR